MTLPASGAVRMGADVDVELSLASTTAISLGGSGVRGLYGVASGAIRLAADGYGKSNLPSFAPIVGGTNNGGTTTYAINDKYTFSSDTSAVGTAAPANMHYNQATGNTSQVIFFVGGTSARRLYSYSGDSWSTGTAFSTSAAFYGGMIGNKTVAINKNSGSVATTQKYTYTTDTTAAGGSLSYASNYGPGCVGNSTQGIFCGGYITTALQTSSKYIYSNDTTSAGGSLAYTGMGCGAGSGAYFMTGIGISTVGIFTGGNDACMVTGTSQTSVYTYSTDGQASGTALNGLLSYTMTCGSTTAGRAVGGATNIQGAGTYIATSSKYTYSSSVVSAGGSISLARGFGAGPGATPAAI